MELSDDDIATTIRVLTKISKNREIFDSSATYRPIRQQLQPLIEGLSKSTRIDASQAKALNIAMKKKQKSNERKEKEQDKRFIANTMMRAGRMADLQRISEVNDSIHENSYINDGSVSLIDNQTLTSENGNINTDSNSSDNNNNNSSSSSSSKIQSVAEIIPTVIIPQVLDGVVHENNPSPLSTTFPTVILQQRISCYICKQKYRDLHYYYDSLCNKCATYNYIKRHNKANLNGYIAIVTGGRVKVGYQTCLKLLRFVSALFMVVSCIYYY